MYTNCNKNTTVLEIPRGVPSTPPMGIDMSSIYEAERRLIEVKTVTPVTAIELMGYFNLACNEAGKYLSWIEYEILEAEKYLDIARSEVILDKAPEMFKKYKDSGIKYSEDFRDAVAARDPDYQNKLNVLNALKAARSLLENKFKSFSRAFYSCDKASTNRSLVAACPSLNGHIGQTYDTPQNNLMGNSFIGKPKL